ncbi:DUF2255 family protein [Streptomyces sp. NBC_00120]|uniref:DUF2255 family protein n=1 Tax=Streptomyces sp. NBC_00120 TaxID=2975660 RepID=UPI00225072FC|nr:DUF2255 family protein [Streptomyces sp. NBC_00120]MCX5326915.1 DUF2255 family protein [Streptomyces sp. NBC_00120]
MRAYNGPSSRWQGPAMTQRAGRIRAGGVDAEVAFKSVDGEINVRIDEAYSDLPAAGHLGAHRAATVRVDPK